MKKTAIVVTTINAPNEAMRKIAEYAGLLDAHFIVVGDTKSPQEYPVDGVTYFTYEDQKKLDFKFAKACPTKHYARKNIGYLLAAQSGVDAIVETDDDNIPLQGFQAERAREVSGDIVRAKGWTNVYKLFSDSVVWPRGLPLTELMRPRPTTLGRSTEICPIQQGLADENPDVDAIYRLAFPLPISFARRPPVLLDKGVWSPFNSQNTTFFREAFLLSYLPYHCSFRMTDIWRSFVAQRIMWECGWRLMFHSSTVYQVRNDHDLMKDFADEIPGYLGNEKIRRALEGLNLKSGQRNIADNVRACYEAIISLGLIGQQEIALLDKWLDDMSIIINRSGIIK